MTVFERIKETAKLRGTNLKNLAKQVGLSENAIYSWKNKTPRTDNVQAVADVLGVSVDYLLGNTDEMHSNKKDDMPVDLEETLSKLGPAVSFGGKELTDEQYLNQSLRIACKALSLDTEPTNPLMGQLVSFITCVSQRLATATMFYVQAIPYNPTAF